MHFTFVAIMSWNRIGQAASAAVLAQSRAPNRDPVEIAPVPLIVVQRIMPARPVVPHRRRADRVTGLCNPHRGLPANRLTLPRNL